MRCEVAGRDRVRGRGRGEGRGGPNRPPDQSGGPLDWAAVWAGCERRLRCWRVPPRWSAREWREEMRAEGAVAVLLALRDYRPERGVPLGAYVRMRVLARVLTRYRQEWSYGLRHAPADRLSDPAGGAGADPMSALKEGLARALERLPDADRWLIERLFWQGETEAEVGRAMGLSQQAISKRKHSVLTLIKRLINCGVDQAGDRSNVAVLPHQALIDSCVG